MIDLELVEEAMLYKLLSLGFSAPNETQIELMCEMTAALEEWLPDDKFERDWGRLGAELRSADPTELRSQYDAVFHEGPDFIGRETHWKPAASKPHLLADINGFYQAFGLELPAQDVAEHAGTPDHIAVELEFMGNLALKRAYARASELPDEERICEDAQISFGRAHLDEWPLLLSRAVAERAKIDFYRVLAAYAHAGFAQ